MISALNLIETFIKEQHPDLSVRPLLLEALGDTHFQIRIDSPKLSQSLIAIYPNFRWQREAGAWPLYFISRNYRTYWENARLDMFSVDVFNTLSFYIARAQENSKYRDDLGPGGIRVP